MKNSLCTSLRATLVFALAFHSHACAPEEWEDADPAESTSALRVANAETADLGTASAAEAVGTGRPTGALAGLDDLVVSDGTPSGGPSEPERLHPWVVDITDTGGENCRGVLIHPSWVLTAAHCIGTFPGRVSYSRMDGRTGKPRTAFRDFDGSGKSRGMFPHPEFVRDAGWGHLRNDIALIRLARPFAINRDIQTVGLPRTPASPGRVGTIASYPHGAGPLPAEHTAIVRTPQVGPEACASSTGFVCIRPPAGSLCQGDSGSGFVMLQGGRAAVVGIASHVKVRSLESYCIEAGGDAQLVDVYHYRAWILGTMGMSDEQVAGRTRVRWTGYASDTSTMSLQCRSQAWDPIEVSMNVPGGEIALDGCDDVLVQCQVQDASITLGGFSRRTLAADGTESVRALRSTETSASAVSRAVSSFNAYTCALSKDGRYVPAYELTFAPQ